MVNFIDTFRRTEPLVTTQNHTARTIILVLMALVLLFFAVLRFRKNLEGMDGGSPEHFQGTNPT